MYFNLKNFSKNKINIKYEKKTEKITRNSRIKNIKVYFKNFSIKS